MPHSKPATAASPQSTLALMLALMGTNKNR